MVSSLVLRSLSVAAQGSAYLLTQRSWTSRIGTGFRKWSFSRPRRLVVTSPELRAIYTFGVAVQSDWTNGSSYEGVAGEQAILAGENLEVDAPRRLVQSFNALWSEDVKAVGTSRVTWEIEPVGDSCRLVVTHDQLREGANDQLYGGWPMILSGLKTLLETGEPLTTPGSLRHAV